MATKRGSSDRSDLDANESEVGSIATQLLSTRTGGVAMIVDESDR